MRVRIDYFDHNEAFAAYLPRTGAVTRTLQDRNGKGPWFLVTLDEPFDYQLKVGEPFQFRLAHVDAFLIRSRWQDTDIGDADGTSVFVLLAEQGRHPEGETFDPADHVHIVWGMCVPVGVEGDAND